MMFFSDNRRNPDFAKDPAVVRMDGRFLMYYSVPPYQDGRPENGWGIGIAESIDLVHWKYLCEIPPLTPLERHGFCAPGARVYDGVVHLFYQTYTFGASDAICHAFSKDGIHFIADSANPIFHPPVSDWSCGRAIDADCIAFKGKIFLYAATRDPEFKIQKLVAAQTSSLSTASRAEWIMPVDRSVLEPELPWEGECIEAPATCIHNGRLYLFYGGAYNNAPQQIGCAVSEDGFFFKRISDSPVFPCGKAGEWNSSESGHPFVFSDRGEDYLFYQGNNDCGKSWHLSACKITWKDGFPHFSELKPVQKI